MLRNSWGQWPKQQDQWSRGGRRGPRPKSRRPQRPRVEALEDRTLLSVDFTPRYTASNPATSVITAGDQANAGLGTNEPSMAVDPNDPANLAISAQNVLAYCSNDGATFSSAQSFPIPAGYNAPAGGSSVSFGDTWAAYNNQDQLFQTNLVGTPNGNRSYSGLIVRPTLERFFVCVA